MGIRKQFLEFFEAAGSGVETRESVWMMGSQECRFSRSEADAWLSARGLARLPADWSNDPEPLFKSLGFAAYVDVDVNEAACRRMDLTEPLDDDCVSVADLVIDSGTLEHIFDAPAAIKNMNRILKPGGVILHLSPVNFFNHGFVNFNPSYFNGFYGENGYSTLFSTYQMTIHNPLRIPGITPWLPMVLARFNLPYENRLGQNWTRMLLRWSAVAPLPRNLLYVAAYKKPHDLTEFCHPTEVWA